MKKNNYTFIDLEYEELFYTYGRSYFERYPPFNYMPDSNGVVLTTLHGEIYYNPVTMSMLAINQFDRYWQMEDSTFLDYAQRHRDALEDLMNEDGYFEYRIDHHHRIDLVLTNPWYSGMAQGQALSLFSRLAYYADDPIAHALADEVYKTLDYNQAVDDEVVRLVDGYAWIEEYPDSIPDHTFNGFMFAIIGLYDYYHLLDDSRSTQKVLSAYLTTIEDNMEQYRNPGGVSYYCLRHHHIDPTYHKIHIKQLDYFTKITDDSVFSIFADTLRMDYWDPEW